jgi:hypothetical protein
MISSCSHSGYCRLIGNQAFGLDAQPVQIQIHKCVSVACGTPMREVPEGLECSQQSLQSREHSDGEETSIDRFDRLIASPKRKMKTLNDSIANFPIPNCSAWGVGAEKGPRPCSRIPTSSWPDNLTEDSGRCPDRTTVTTPPSCTYHPATDVTASLRISQLPTIGHGGNLRICTHARVWIECTSVTKPRRELARSFLLHRPT